MLSKFLALKIYAKTPDMLKRAFKSMRGRWNGTLLSWVFPLEARTALEALLKANPMRCEMKEISLLDERVNSQQEYLYGKYSSMVKRLYDDETRLYDEVSLYERGYRREIGINDDGSTKYDLPYTLSMYQDPPDPQMPPEQFVVENDFHKRLLECIKKRDEIKQIDAELKTLEKLNLRKNSACHPQKRNDKPNN